MNQLISDKDYNCIERCLVLSDGTKIYRHLCDECVDCNPNEYEKEYYTDSLGNKISPPDLTDAKECKEGHSDCVKWSSLVTGIDNTGTRYDASYTFEVTLSNGIVFSVNQTPTGGWTQQLNQWVINFGAEINALYPTTVVEARCNTATGCGGLLPAPTDVNFNSMFWRYMQITACPTDAAPIKVEITASSIASHLGKVLAIEFFKTPEQRGYVCYDCGEEPVLHYRDGSIVDTADIPVCYFECAESLPELPQTSCQIDFEEEGCDNVNDTDTLNWVSIYRRYVTCEGGETTIEYYIEDTTDPSAPVLVDYILIGEFVDCESGEVIEVPCDKEIIAVEQKYDIVPGTTESARHFITLGFSPPTALPNGSTVTYGGVTVNIPDGQLFDESPDNPNAVTGSIPWIQWLNDNFPTADAAFVPTSGQDSTWMCGAWEINAPGFGIIPSQSVLDIDPNFPGAICTIEGGEDQCIEIQEIKEKDCEGNETYRFVKEDGNGNLIEYLLQGELKNECSVIEDCGSFTSNCMCYGDDSTSSSDYTYELGEKDPTEGTFSMNANTIKWQTSGGLVSSIPYIDDCITNGGESTITITDQDGNIIVFTANGFLNPAGTTPTTAYSGTGPGGFSGKIRSLVISCSSNEGGESGKACQWISCDKLTEKWFDGTRELTAEEIETLVECTIPVSIEPECDIDIIQLQACSNETTSEVAIGDLILTVAQQDCNAVIISSTQYNITQGNTELTEAVDTTDCNPQPDIAQTEECILDIKGVKWTEITIVQGTVTTTIYISQEKLVIGTPEGEPSEWTSCVESSCGPVDRHCFCVVSKGKSSGGTKGKVVAKEKSSSTTAGKILNVCRLRWWNCVGEVLLEQYEYQGRLFTAEEYEKQSLTEVSCDSPDVTYSPGAVTCATVDIEGVIVVLNCTVFTNDSDPTDLFTSYTLAADYTTQGIGSIGDAYTPSTTLTVIECAPGSITETEECFEATNSIKGVINAGEQINVVSVTNSVSGTTVYTIKHVPSQSVIYTGVDPVADVGIDTTNTSQWTLVDCGEPDPEPSISFSTVCKKACVKGAEVDVIIGYDPEGNVLWYKDENGNTISNPDFESNCPPLTCETSTTTLCADGDYPGISDGDAIILVINNCSDGSSTITGATLLSNPTASLLPLPANILFQNCNTSIETELVGCVVDEDGTKWNVILIDGSTVAYQNQSDNSFGTPVGTTTECTPVNKIVSSIDGKYCIEVEGVSLSAFLFINDDGTVSAKEVGGETIYVQGEYTLISCCPGERTETVHLAGTTVSRPADTPNAGWNNEISAGTPALSGDFTLCFTPTAQSGNTPQMIGINSDPNTNSSFSSIDNAVYLYSANGLFRIYHYSNGSNQGLVSSVNWVGQEICFERVGSTLTATIGGSFLFSRNIGTADVFLDDSHYFAAGFWGTGSITYSDFTLVTSSDDTTIRNEEECCCKNQEDKKEYLYIQDCWEEDVDTTNTKKIVSVYEDNTFPLILTGHLEEDKTTLANITGWTITKPCNCK